MKQCNCDWATGECQGPLECQEIESLRAQLASARLAAQSAAPVGWRLVPIEPTQEMVTAAYKDQTAVINVGFAQAYRTMIGVAPTAPASIAPQWQPIETAPKIGEFLVYLPEEHRKYQVMYRTERTSVVGGAFAFDMSKPTLWMPITVKPGEQP